MNERTIETVNEHIPTPDYEAMWTSIQQEANRRRSSQLKPLRVQRQSFMTSAVVFLSVIMLAVPAFAGVVLNWERLTGGASVSNALNQGLGQRYEGLQVTYSDVVMSLHGVVTDSDKMKLLISVDPNEDVSLYDVVGFEGIALQGASGTNEEVKGTLSYDQESNKLLGIYETKNTLQNSKKKYTLAAENLILYKQQNTALSSSHEGERIATGSQQYPSIHFQSVTEAKDGIVVRYLIEALDQGEGNPHLLVKKAGSNEFIESVPTVLPHGGSGLLIEQMFHLSQKEWQASTLHLSSLEQVKKITGIWDIDFNVDGRKASEAMYSQALIIPANIEHTSGMALDNLVITPLQIQVHMSEHQIMEKYQDGVVQYKDVRLVVGDRELAGEYVLKKNDNGHMQFMYVFESPEWYKDWSEVPMKLLLKEGVITKRDKNRNWITLNKPSEAKQYTTLDLGGYQVDYSYYIDDNELVVEATSQTEGFKGISQTMMRVNGEEIYPELVARGMEAPSTHVDRYSNLDFNANLELNPGFYRYSDPSRDIEVHLN